MVVGGCDEPAELAEEEAEVREHVSRSEFPAGEVTEHATRRAGWMAVGRVRHAGGARFSAGAARWRYAAPRLVSLPFLRDGGRKIGERDGET